MVSATGVAPTSSSSRADGGSSLNELAVLEAAGREKRQLLEEAARIAAADLGPKQRVPVGSSPDELPALLQRYYWSEPAAEVLGHDPHELAALALGHLRLAEVRP